MNNGNTSAIGVQQITLAKKPDLTTNLGKPPVTDAHLSGETNTRLAAALGHRLIKFKSQPDAD